MLDKKFLEDLAVKQEAGYQNILREYVQNLFLSSFYAKDGSQNFLFKGGTALKIVFNSPRFSEDLDFTGVRNGKKYEEVLESAMVDLVDGGIDVSLTESKETSGGHLANMAVNLFGQEIKIKNQISFREGGQIEGENVVVTSDLVPSYNLFLLSRSVLVGEKVRALIDRAKPRDFFDLYFILRKDELRKEIKISREDREVILERIEVQKKEVLERELKRLLPKGFWRVIDDLPGALKREFV